MKLEELRKSFYHCCVRPLTGWGGGGGARVGRAEGARIGRGGAILVFFFKEESLS